MTAWFAAVPSFVDGSNGYYFIAAAGLAVVALVSISLRRRREIRQGPRLRSRADSAPARPFAGTSLMDEASARQGVRDDMDQLLVELHDLSRKISAQIETQFAKLEAAIADADRRIAELHRLAGTPPPTGIDITVGQEPEPTAAAPTANADARPNDGAGGTAAPATTGDGIHARVIALAEAGKSPVEIARVLGRPPGEIELILSLRPRSQRRSS